MLVRPPYGVEPSPRMIVRLREHPRDAERRMIARLLRAAVRAYQWFLRPLLPRSLPLSSELLRVRGGGARAATAPGAAAGLPRGASAAAAPGIPAATTRCRDVEKMDTQRLILLFIFSFSVLMLWEAWESRARPKPPPRRAAQQQGVPAARKPAAPGAPLRSPAAGSACRAGRCRAAQGRNDPRHAPISSSPRSTRSAAR